MLITFFFILCTLLFGVVCDLLAAAAGPEPAASLRARWRTEQLFLPRVLPVLRARAAEALFWIGAVLLLAEDLCLLLIQQFLPFVSETAFSVALAGSLCAIFVVRIACQPFSFRQLAAMTPVFVLAGLVLAATPGSAYTDMVAQPVCLFLFFMHAPLRRVIKVGLGIKAAYMALTIGLCLTGRIPDHWNWIGDVDRIALGFGHFNVLGKALVELLLLYVCLRFIRWRWWDSLLLAAVSVFIWVVPRSRTAFLALLVLLALVLAARLFPRLFQNRLAQLLLAMSWGLSALFSLLAGWLYGSSAFLDKLDDLLSGRLFLMHQQMLGPAVRWFGTVSNGTLDWYTALSPDCWALDRQAGLYNYNFLDNGYAFCLYMAGPLFLAAFCLGYGLLIRRFLRRGPADWPLAFLLIVMALYTVTERVFADFWIVILLGNLWASRPLSLADNP